MAATLLQSVPWLFCFVHLTGVTRAFLINSLDPRCAVGCREAK